MSSICNDNVPMSEEPQQPRKWGRLTKNGAPHLQSLRV